MTPTHDIPTTRRLLDAAIRDGTGIGSETRAIARQWVDILETEGHHDYAKTISSRVAAADAGAYGWAVRQLDRAIGGGGLPDDARQLLEAQITAFREAGMSDAATCSSAGWPNPPKPRRSWPP